MPTARKALALGGLFASALALSACQAAAPAGRAPIAGLDLSAPGSGAESIGRARVHDRLWLGDEIVEAANGDPLPAHLDAADAVSVRGRRAMTLREAVSAIGARGGPLGVSVSVEDAPGLGLGDPDCARPVTGSLRSVLDGLAAACDATWTHDAATGAVRMRRAETRTFEVAVMSGTAPQAALWDGIRGTVDALVAGKGRAVAAPALGTLTVTAAPSTLRAVADLVERQNAARTQTVAVSARLVALDLPDGGFRLADALALAAGGTLSFEGLGSAGTGAGIVRMPRAGAPSLDAAVAALAASARARVVDGIATTAVSDQGRSAKVGPLSLDATPRLLADGRVLLDLSVSGRGDSVSQAAVLRPGETLALAAGETDEGGSRRMLVLLVSPETLAGRPAR